MSDRKGRRALGARDLGIDVASGRERALFDWFLACLLFGKPIQQELARRAHLELPQRARHAEGHPRCGPARARRSPGLREPNPAPRAMPSGPSLPLACARGGLAFGCIVWLESRLDE